MTRPEVLQIFTRVAELESFTRAAQALGVPKASASTAIGQLEASLGTRLLHRTTRKVQLTQDGHAVYERCKALLADLDAIESMFRGTPDRLQGRLRVDMPSAVASEFVMPHLPRFLDAHPDLALELSSVDRRVDLVREGFDCVLRVGSLGDSSLVARPLGHFRLVGCASQAYLARYGTPRTLVDLASHRLVHYVPMLGGQTDGWEFRHDGGEGRVAMAGALTVNTVEAYKAACLAGLGLIQAPACGLAPQLASGLLVEVLTDLAPAPMPVSLLYANRRNLATRVRVFMDWLAGTLAPHLDPVTAAR